MGHAELTIQDQAVTKRISLDEYWMPFTPNREFKADPQMVVRAEGMYLWNDRGDQIIDASSGLFCVSAGHGRKEIADAVGAQLRELDFCAPFLRAHPKQFELASRVAELTPGDLNRIFFVNSGSESVDTAMKVALAYHQARGQGGTQHVRVTRARLSRRRLRRRRAVRPRQQPPQVRRGMPAVAHMRHTHLKENYFTQGEGAHGVELAEDLVRFVTLYGAENIAACFVEPIAGSSGCLVPPKGYLKRLREICDAHGILLVFDEVICGFGRTGQTFAAQSFGVTPDILTMAKGLTNGSQPMGAVAVSERIHDTIMGAAPRARSSSSTATRIPAIRRRVPRGSPHSTSTRTKACSSAAARCRRTFSMRCSRCGMFSRRRHSRLRDVRDDRCPRGRAPGKRGQVFQKKLFANGLNLKTTGDSAIIAPPLIAEKKHVDEIADILRRTLKAL
jgi:beta-alanine--pyruvate transaminase